MIASCWDWPSLKYSYYLIESQPLDAGGWSPTRGIHRDKLDSSNTTSVAFEDILPSLPNDAFFAGVGDYCIGELFEKRDTNTRQKVDMEDLKTRQNPQSQKVLELLEGASKPLVCEAPLEARENPNAESRIQRRTIFQRVVPLVATIGTGFLMFRTMQSLSKSQLTLRDVMFSWGTGLALGIAIAQEASKQDEIQKDISNDT